MNLLSKILISTGIIASAFTATVAMANPYKSTNVKAALIQDCKTNITKGGKLTATEVNKFCTCQVETEGKMTLAQQWELASAVNAKKAPSSLPFMQQQNKSLQACFGADLTAKLKKLTEQEMQKQAKK